MRSEDRTSDSGIGTDRWPASEIIIVGNGHACDFVSVRDVLSGCTQQVARISFGAARQLYTSFQERVDKETIG